MGSVHDLFNSITAGKNELEHYASLFESVDGLPTDVPRLAEIRARLHVDGDFAPALRRLRRIMRLGNGRRSSVFGVPYVAFQILFFWDFHVLERLEKWQSHHGRSVRGWFQSVAELEALASLATMAADHPDWAYPTVSPDAERIVANGLGHPLLPVDRCVRNDVILGPPGTFLLVTGSNMSGNCHESPR